MTAKGLRHGSTDQEFADAITKCQSGDPSWCSHHGECQRDGECFARHRKSKLEELESRIEKLEAQNRRLKSIIGD